MIVLMKIDLMGKCMIKLIVNNAFQAKNDNLYEQLGAYVYENNEVRNDDGHDENRQNGELDDHLDMNNGIGNDNDLLHGQMDYVTQGGEENDQDENEEPLNENEDTDESEDEADEDDSDEEGDNDERNLDYEQLLYPGASLTVSQSMSLILLLVRHNVTQTCLGDIITVIKVDDYFSTLPSK
ncbi:101 kDa malaria antigen-like [Cotesia glomerata]|uniref:101 kDa malaria antigen-like n=1 Tax=Cotesia glomerata TaxID=32391 RepID=UPI001D035536|nr:101 kDa malaria antigen-like [Cotesia glomerata]